MDSPADPRDVPDFDVVTSASIQRADARDAVTGVDEPEMDHRSAARPEQESTRIPRDTTSQQIAPGVAPWWVPTLVGVYLLVCALVAVVLIIDAWSGEFRIYEALLPWLEIPAGDASDVALLTYTCAGGVLGGVMVSFQGLHVYGAVRRTFKMSFVGSYLIGPWVAAFIGLAAHALVRGGLLAFGGPGDVSASGAPTSTSYAYLALGVMTGYAWNLVLEKLGALAGELFSTQSRTDPDADVADADAGVVDSDPTHPSPPRKD